MNFSRTLIILALPAACIASYGSGCTGSGTYPSPIFGTGASDAGTLADSGDDGGDAGPNGPSTAPANAGSETDMECQAMTAQACLGCCAANHQEAYYAFSTAMSTCACGIDGGGGVCAQSCGAEYCAGKAPAAGDACSACLAASVEQDAGGRCLAVLAYACPTGGPCDAYLTCANYCR